MYQNQYNKLKVIAEMQDSWDHPDLIILRLVRCGFYVDTSHVHPDRLKTVMDQIEFMRDIKKILLSVENSVKLKT